MDTSPILHDSEEWREVQKSLQKLSDGQGEIGSRLVRYDDRQIAQHRANKEEIMQMKLTLYGVPGDEENIGLIRKMDRMLNYGSATVFWIRALAGLLTLSIALGGLYVAFHH